jgi:hypothetical protein
MITLTVKMLVFMSGLGAEMLHGNQVLVTGKVTELPPKCKTGRSDPHSGARSGFDAAPSCPKAYRVGDLERRRGPPDKGGRPSTIESSSANSRNWIACDRF